MLASFYKLLSFEVSLSDSYIIVNLFDLWILKCLPNFQCKIIIIVYFHTSACYICICKERKPLRLIEMMGPSYPNARWHSMGTKCTTTLALYLSTEPGLIWQQKAWILGSQLIKIQLVRLNPYLIPPNKM